MKSRFTTEKGRRASSNGEAKRQTQRTSLAGPAHAARVTYGNVRARPRCRLSVVQIFTKF
ncbi:hypothetical protein D8B20_14360 [Candidatus Pantoea soli]|uniref:Uncharacterized protein n=1 Tax=Candidatus Pantoea soli TaxID=3098669 RepID=A0A518XFT4_9GAMM|nr:hypothetical protein D8B20_14360 [Pantoea soli]